MGPEHRATGLSGDIWKCFSRRAIVPKTLSTTPINGAFSLFQPEGESTTLGTSAEGSDPVNGINAFEKRFCVFDAVPSNVTVIREDRTVIFVNAALRWRVGDLRGRKCNETELGSEETCRGCPLEKGWPESAFPYSRVVRDDDDQLVELVTTRVKDPDTGISYYVCFERDVTQAAENERHIRRLTSSLDQMGEAVSVLDTAGKVIYVNKAFEVMTGFQGTAVTGMPSLDLVNKDHTPESVESMMRQASEHGWSGELTSVVKDGQRHFISIDATPVKDGAGDPLGVVAVFKDVTRTKTEKAELDKYRSQLEEKMEARTNELARRVSQLTTINKIGRVVTSILDPDELMGEFVKSIANGFNYTHVCILMMDKEHGELYYKSGYGIKFTRLSHDLRLKLKEGIVGHAAYFSETLVTGDVRSDPRYVPGEVEGIQSEMAVPITFRGELLGVLDIQSELKDAFSRSEVTLLEMLADILASAITTAATYTESKEREQALSVLDRISKQISFRLEPTVILDQVARDAALLLKAEKALIGLIAEGRNELRWVASYNVDKEVLTSRRFNSNKGITGRAMKRLKTEVVNDYDSDPEALEPGNRIFEMRSIVSAPLTVEGRGIGVINVYNKAADNGFTKSDALILSSLADHAAIALENANLLSSLNQRVRSQLALLDTAVSLQRQIDSSSIYETVADKLRDVTFYDAITIYKVDHARGLMVPQVAKGSYVEEIMSEVFPIGDGISGYVAKSGKAELVNETRKDDRVVQVSGTPVDQETLMAVPLKGKDLVIGVMTLYRDGGKIFTETDLETAQLFANQAAVAVENSELYGTTGLLLEESRRKVEQMAQVLELTTSVMYMDDIDALLQRITNAVVASFGFRRAHIALIDPSGETLTTHAMAGYPEWVGSGRPVPLSRVLLDLQEQFRICKSCFYVPFEKQTYGIEQFDFLAHPELADKPRPGPDAWHERDVVDFALRDRSGRFIGYLLVDEPNDLKVPEKEQLETLEVLVGIAVHRGRELEAVRQAGVRGQRDRPAERPHDTRHQQLQPGDHGIPRAPAPGPEAQRGAEALRREGSRPGQEQREAHRQHTQAREGPGDDEQGLRVRRHPASGRSRHRVRRQDVPGQGHLRRIDGRPRVPLHKGQPLRLRPVPQHHPERGQVRHGQARPRGNLVLRRAHDAGRLLAGVRDGPGPGHPGRPEEGRVREVRDRDDRDQRLRPGPVHSQARSSRSSTAASGSRTGSRGTSPRARPSRSCSPRPPRPSACRSWSRRSPRRSLLRLLRVLDCRLDQAVVQGRRASPAST